MTEKNIKVILEIKNKGIKAEMVAIISSVGGFQICREHVNSHSTDFYDLLVLEIGDDFNEGLNFANTLQSSGIVKNVFLVSALIHQEMLINALRMGVKEFFSTPVKKEEVVAALLKIKKQTGDAEGGKEPTKKGKIINVLGCKGGAGTTTIAVNLAVSLAELEEKPSVVIIDLDQSYGEILHTLSLKAGSDWVQVVRNISRVDKMYLMSALARHPSGIYVLPSPDVDETDSVISIQSLSTLLKFMQTLFDFIVLDSGQRIDEYSDTVLRMSDRVLLVFYVSIACIIKLKKLLYMFSKRGYPKMENVELIVNRYIRDDAISLKELENALHGKKVLCCIPDSYKITMSAINSGQPLCTTEKRTDICRKFKELALACLGQEDKEKKKEKGFSISSLIFG